MSHFWHIYADPHCEKCGARGRNIIKKNTSFMPFIWRFIELLHISENDLSMQVLLNHSIPLYHSVGKFVMMSFCSCKAIQNNCKYKKISKNSSHLGMMVKHLKQDQSRNGSMNIATW